jgi:hypothetical protein
MLDVLQGWALAQRLFKLLVLDGAAQVEVEAVEDFTSHLRTAAIPQAHEHAAELLPVDGTTAIHVPLAKLHKGGTRRRHAGGARTVY